MRSLCKIKDKKPICATVDRGKQKYCNHACTDMVHTFCAYGYPGSECKEPNAIKEAKDL